MQAHNMSENTMHLIEFKQFQTTEIRFDIKNQSTLHLILKSRT